MRIGFMINLFLSPAAGLLPRRLRRLLPVEEPDGRALDEDHPGGDRAHPQRAGHGRGTGDGKELVHRAVPPAFRVEIRGRGLDGS